MVCLYFNLHCGSRVVTRVTYQAAHGLSVGLYTWRIGLVVTIDSFQRATIALMKQKSPSSVTGFNDLIPGDVSRPAKKRDYRVWIYLPFLIGVLALAGIIFLVVRAGFGSMSAWADASLALLLLPMIVLGLIPLVLVGLTIFGIVKLIGVLPESFQSVMRIFGQAEKAAQQAGDIAVRPVITAKSSWAGLQASCGWLVSIVKIIKGETHD